jgi:long-chain acyl-CoA synthetase
LRDGKASRIAENAVSEARPAGGLLLTGATGFVGMELLERFLERTERPVYALVRGGDEREARGRLREVAGCLFGDPDAHADRLHPVRADLERPGLGLDDRARERLAAEVTDVVHSAASVSFSLGLEDSRRINVAGTARVLDLARLCRRRGGLRRFSYVSTAYVAGTHAGEFTEDQLDVGQEFRNPYERSKFEAERLVRAHSDELAVQVFRPSIVVGERATGWTASFNVLYSPLKAFAGGALPMLPARGSAPVDVVPIDYVADAVYELCSVPVEPGRPQTYHLVCGDRATTVERLVALSAAYFRRRRPALIPPGLYRRLVHPVLLRRSRGARRRALRRMEVFFPYLAARVRYDDRRARARLEPAGVRVTPLERYFDRLVDYAQAARWGREGTLPRRSAAEGRQRAAH